MAGPRVALLAFDLPGDAPAPTSYALSLARALDRHGVAVHLFSNVSLDFPRCVAIATPSGVSGPVATARALCSTAAAHVDRIGRELGAFDAIHAVQWSSAPVALGSARRGSCKSVVTFLDTVFSRHGHVNGTPEVAQVRVLEQQAAEGCDTILAASEPVRQEIAWLYGRSAPRQAITPLAPVDVLSERPEAPKSPYQVAFAGTWDDAGGADLFIEIARLLAARATHWRFCLGADTVAAARLESDLRRRGRAELFARFDFTPDAATARQQASLVVVPARSDGNASAIHAAWAHARPVAVTRSGPHHDVSAGIDGYIAIPRAPALAECVERALSDPPRSRAMGEAGRHKVENNFTWSAVASKVSAIYR